MIDAPAPSESRPAPTAPERPPVLRGAMIVMLTAACAMFALIAASQQAQIGNLSDTIDGLRTTIASGAVPQESQLADASPLELKPTAVMAGARLEVLRWHDQRLLVASDVPRPGTGKVYRVWAMHADAPATLVAEAREGGRWLVPLEQAGDRDATGYLVNQEVSRLRPRTPRGQQAALGMIAE